MVLGPRGCGPDFRLELERAETIRPGRVLAFLRVTGSGRTSGLQVMDATPTANVYDLVEGKIRRVRIFMDRHEALEAAGCRGSGDVGPTELDAAW